MTVASLRAHATILAVCVALPLAACGVEHCDPGQEIVNPACRVPDAGSGGPDAGTADVPATDDGAASPDGSSDLVVTEPSDGANDANH